MLQMIAQLDNDYIRIRPHKALTRLISYLFFEGRPVTTKGRWINPLVLLNLKVFKHIPVNNRVHKPVFIVGCGRSGTTILGKILSLHPVVGFLNEPKAIWHTIYDSEDVIGNYTMKHARYMLNEEDASQETIINARRIFSIYLILTRTTRLVDKYPELIFRIPFVKTIFPDAKFVLPVRNGYATCNSIVEWSATKSVSKKDTRHDWWGVNGRKWQLLIEDVLKRDTYFSALVEKIHEITSPWDMATVEWIVTMKVAIDQLSKHKSSFYTLKYEELVRNPALELSQLLDFLELRQDSEMIQYASRILKPANNRGTFHISPELKHHFDEIMITLGYGE